MEYPLGSMFKLFVCAVCQVDMKPGEGISVHSGCHRGGRVRPWDGPFLCPSCLLKKDAMEGKRPSGGRLFLKMIRMLAFLSLNCFCDRVSY